MKPRGKLSRIKLVASKPVQLQFSLILNVSGTGESAIYANVILKKGIVVAPAAGAAAAAKKAPKTDAEEGAD